MKKALIFIAELVFTLAVIAIILALVDVQKVVQTLENANPYFFIAAALAYFMIAMIMAFRLKYILQGMGHKVSMASIAVSNFAGLLLADFTPARSGYLATALMVSAKEKIPIEKTSVAILAPQLFEFLLKVSMGGVALVYVAMQFSEGEMGSMLGLGASVVIVFGMLIFGVLLLFSKRFLRMLSLLERIPFFGKYGYGLLKKMHENTLAVKRLIPFILTLLLFGWAFKSLEWVLLANCIGMEPNTALPPIVFYAFFQPLITLLQFIPTPTLAGIGLSEAGAAAVFMLFGVPPHQSITFLLLTRADTIAINLIGIQEARQAMKKYMSRLF